MSLDVRIIENNDLHPTCLNIAETAIEIIVNSVKIALYLHLKADKTCHWMI